MDMVKMGSFLAELRNKNLHRLNWEKNSVSHIRQFQGGKPELMCRP